VPKESEQDRSGEAARGRRPKQRKEERQQKTRKEEHEAIHDAGATMIEKKSK